VGFIDQLTEKSWLTEGDQADGTGNRVSVTLPAANFGLRVFLGVAMVLFTLFFVAYAERMTYGDWRTLPEPWVLWVNTALLILGSLGMQRAWNAADRGQLDVVKAGLLAGGGCAVAFLVGQLLVWQQLMALGYYAAANPANAFFYVITALHALHLLGGLVAWGRTAAKVWRDDEVGKIRVSVELCAIYWHFLLVVWVALFGLLLFT
jgi:cytochrome c oxidase subunit 3